MRLTLLVLVFVSLRVSLMGQANYYYSPNDTLYCTPVQETFTENQIDILTDSPDSVFLSWRLVGNTLPPEWDVNLCDNGNCFSGLPNDGFFNGFSATNGKGYIKLTINPWSVSGQGEMVFRIYPTGFPNDFTTMVFVYDFSLPTAVEDIAVEKGSLFPNPTTGLVWAPIAPGGGQYTLIDARGQALQTGQLPLQGPLALDLTAYPAGLYRILTAQNDSIRSFTTIRL